MVNYVARLRDGEEHGIDCTWECADVAARVLLSVLSPIRMISKSSLIVS